MSDQINQTKQDLKMSGMAVASLVLGIIAAVTSFIPIVNNAAAFIAFLGIIFGIVGIVGIFRGKKKSKVFGIIALALNVIAIVIVLATQSLYSNALNDVTGNPAKSAKGATETNVGNPLNFDNGLEITVVSVQQGLKNYDGTDTSKVIVKYENKGNKEVSYNTYDWKLENSQGAQTNVTVYSNGSMTSNADALSSGKLAPNGSVTGSLYFKGDAKKVLYSSNMFSEVSGTWFVS